MTLSHQLATLEASGLIRSIHAAAGTPNGAYSFCHALMQEAVYGSLLRQDRRQLHQTVAEVLELLHPVVEATDLTLVLGRHLAQAGQAQRALHYLLQAAARAEAQFANSEAAQLYTEALALLPKESAEAFPVLLARCRVHDVMANRAAQQADVEALCVLAAKLGNADYVFEASLARVDYHLATNFSPALALAQHTLQLAEKMGPAAQAQQGRALVRLGYVYWAREEWRAAHAAFESAAAQLKAAGQLSESARCLHSLALILNHIQKYEAAHQAAETALTLSRNAHDARNEAISLRRLASVLDSLGQEADALALGQQALASHQAQGDLLEECHALNLLGIVYGRQQNWALSERYHQQALTLAEGIGASVGIANATGHLADLWLAQRRYLKTLHFLEARLAKARVMQDGYVQAKVRRRYAVLLADIGQTETALAEAQTVLGQTAPGLMATPEHLEWRIFMGRCLADLDNFAGAQATLDAALADAVAAAHPPGLAQALYELANLAAAVGAEAALRGALGGLQRALHVLREGHSSVGLACALNTAADLHWALHEPEAAWRCSTECLAVIARVKVAPVLAERFWFTQARLLRALGQAAEGREYLQRAYHEVQQMAAQLPAGRWREGWLLNVRANRAILKAWTTRRQWK